MSIDKVWVTESVCVVDEHHNTSHYEVTMERRRAAGNNFRGERMYLEIRCNGIPRIQVEMPGEVGGALMWVVRQAFEKFDIESMTGNAVKLGS